MGDADAIARIQVAGWRRAYSHILPPAYLGAIDARERAERWRGRVGTAAHADSPTFVAVDDVDPRSVLGFVHTGPLRDDDLEPAGRAEIFTVYVDPDAWRQGIGSALMDAVEAFWKPAGIRELSLWVFEDNHEARAFYERLGWADDGGRQTAEFGGVHPVERRYRRTIAL